MDTQKIRAVLTAARLGSLSKAAEEFSYTPSAFSHMLSSFEQELGICVFKRCSTGVSWSEEGAAIAPQLEALLKSEQELLDAVSLLMREKHREIRIATYSSISRNLLSRLLADFKRLYPGILLSVHVADDLRGWLEQERADVVFADNDVLEGTQWCPILSDHYVAIAPPDWLVGKEVISREELYRYPHIFTGDSYLRSALDPSRFSELIYFKSEDDLSLLDMVRAGMGVALMPRLSLGKGIGDLRVLELCPHIERTLGFSYRRLLRQDPEVLRFVKYIKRQIPLLRQKECD